MPGSEHRTWAYRAVSALSRPLIRHAFRLDATGVEHLPSGGFVLSANHLSALDPWALSQPLHPRQPRYMTRSDVFRPVLRPLLANAGLFPVHRGPCPVAAVSTATAFARSGRVVVIFPEGIRRKKACDGRTWPHPGAAHVALTAGVPLVPAAVAGTERLRDAPWRVAFGAPIELVDLVALPRREATQLATERLWSRIQQLEEQVR